MKMSLANSVLARKQCYFAKLTQLLEEYSKVFIVTADNVGSNQMQKIRQSLRGEATILMGKNTMMRKAIRDHLTKNPQWEQILPLIKDNVGFVFVSGDLGSVRSKILASKLVAPAKAGTIAPNDVWVPRGTTGMEPTQTAFLQSMNIPSKISRGQIEIVQDVFLIKTGQKVGTSEATLLTKLNIKPFSYGLSIKHVYDNGVVYEASVAARKEEDLLGKFCGAVNNIAALGLEIGYPTIASLPHSVIDGFKNVLAVGMNADYSFQELEQVKNVLENPGPFVDFLDTTTTTTNVEERDDQPEDDDEGDMILDLFDLQ